MIKINNEEWNDMKSLPKENQKCKVLILKDITYTKKTKDGNFEWQEDKQGEHRFFAWKPFAGKNNE